MSDTKEWCEHLQIRRDYERLRYLAFPDEIKARNRSWELRNPEKARAKRRRNAPPKHITREFARLKRLAFPGRTAAIKKWHANNPEKVRAAAVRYYWRNRTKIRERVRLKNLEPAVRDDIRERVRLWKLANPDSVAACNANRRCRLRSAADKMQKIAIKKIYARAAVLRNWFNVVVDHIVPLSKNGRHEPPNLQIIYRFENDRKGNRIGYKPSVIFR